MRKVEDPKYPSSDFPAEPVIRKVKLVPPTLPVTCEKSIFWAFSIPVSRSYPEL